MLQKDLPFTQAEFDRRLDLTRTAMEAAGIDLLFVLFRFERARRVYQESAGNDDPARRTQ